MASLLDELDEKGHTMVRQVELRRLMSKVKGVKCESLALEKGKFRATAKIYCILLEERVGCFA